MGKWVLMGRARVLVLRERRARRALTRGRRFFPVGVGPTVAAVLVERPVRGLTERLAGAEGGGGGAGGEVSVRSTVAGTARVGCHAEGNQAQLLCVGRGKHAQARHDLFQGAKLHVVDLKADGCARAMARSRRRPGRAQRALRCTRPRSKKKKTGEV